MANPEEPADWDGGHKVIIKLDDKCHINGVVEIDRVETPPGDLSNDFKKAEMGRMKITEAG